MISLVSEWIERRTGAGQLLHEALYEPIPGGAKFRYITGSMLVFAFVTQTITGLFLWMGYSPSSQTAYESVYFIQHEMTGGWLLRGIHHFMAQAMVVVMALHLLQVIVDGAYRAPREVNYWLGLVLMKLVLGLGLTGYLLPWDQKGYWATNVATNLMAIVPLVGKDIQAIAIGGGDYGHHTLTRFFAMHAGVLPALLVVFLALHIAVFRKHGITTHAKPGDGSEYFWPKQVLFDAIGCLVLLAIVLLCVIHFDVQGLVKGDLPLAHRGAELGAPADPSLQYSAARPEWYYLFLFQLLKYFHGTQEIIGAIYIPGAVVGVLFLMPFIGKFEIGHKFNIAFIVALLLGAGALTGLAIKEDLDNPEFLQAKIDAEHEAVRTVELINRRETLEDGRLSDRRMIQKPGAVYLLRNDPLTQGPRLFAQHCASCHNYASPEQLAAAMPPAATMKLAGGSESATAEEKSADEAANGKAVEAKPAHDAHARPQPQFIVKQGAKTKSAEAIERDADGKPVYEEFRAGAPNLYRFASREWIAGVLDKGKLTAETFGEPVPSKSTDPKIKENKDHPDHFQRPVYSPYFGSTNQRGGRMAQWVAAHGELLKNDPAKDDDDVDAIVAALSAQAQLGAQQSADAKDQALIAKGAGLINQNCARGCHRFGSAGELGLAPDLTGYGSYEWMLGLISNPGHERFYRMENDRMPAFAQDLAHPERNSVSIRELSLIVDWIRGDYYRPSDEKPVLPHSEEYARKTVERARTVDKPALAVIGGAPPAPETPAQKAQRLFVANCSHCHNHTSGDGRGLVAKLSSAPNLSGFGSREWLAGLLDHEQVGGPKYFGDTKHFEGDMVTFVKDNLTELDADQKAALAALVVALSAEAQLPAQAEADKKAAEDGTLEKGKTALAGSIKDGATSCVDCHKYHDNGELGSAPDLTGYASRQWLIDFIGAPDHERFYSSGNDRMPAFAASGPGPKQALLTKDEIELLAKWLRGEPLEAK